MPSKWRITITLPSRIKQFLENWAAKQNRSVSNLAATILIGIVDGDFSSVLSLQPGQLGGLTPKGLAGIAKLSSRLGFASLSDLVESVGRGEVFITRYPSSLKELTATWDYDELAKEAAIPIERLNEIIETGKLTPDDLIGLARALDIKAEVIYKASQQQEYCRNGI